MDWACNDCAEKQPEIYDDAKVFEHELLECEICGKPTPKLNIPRTQDAYNE